MNKFLAALLPAIALASCAHVDSTDSGAAPQVAPAAVGADAGLIDAVPRVAVATAFSPEFAALIPFLDQPVKHVINGRPYYTGTMAGRPVILFETGVSIVNAAMNTQVLFDHFAVTAIVVSGIAGGVSPDLAIGDVTVPAQWGQYNEMIYMRELPDGGYATYRDGYASQAGENFAFAPFEFMQPDGVRIVSAADPRPDRQFWFASDPQMLEVAHAIAGEIDLARCSSAGQCLDTQPRLVVGGNGVTGSVFQDNARFREYLDATFQAHVVEMETSAIAMVAHANAKPFIAFRSLSDLAGGGTADQNEMQAFEDTAAENAAAVVLEFLRRYPS